MEKAKVDRLLRILLVVSLLPVLVVVIYLRSGQGNVAVPAYTVEIVGGGTKEHTTVQRRWSEMGLFGFLRTEDDYVPWSGGLDESKVRLIRHESWFNVRDVILSLLIGGALPCVVGVAHWFLVTRKQAEPGAAADGGGT